MARQTDTDWIREGSKVAIYRDSYSGDGSFAIDTIAKLTKTQIVLASGQRFNRERLTLVGGSSYTAPTLKPLNDPKVVQASAATSFRQVINAVDDLGREHRNGRRVGPTQILAMLDEIEQMVADARKAITSAQRVAEGS